MKSEFVEEHRMRKYLSFVHWIAIAVLIIAWIVIGIHLADNNYDFLTWAYIALVCVVLIAICSLIKAFGAKCPHCGKRLTADGKFCPYCGKEIKESEQRF